MRPRELVLDPGARTVIEAAARAARPREACGLLLGPAAGRARRALVTRNLALDPDRFEVDPAAVVHAEDLARAHGEELVGVWHSHPNASARPSSDDLVAAWGGWLHLIAGTDGLRAWRVAEGAPHELPVRVPLPSATV